MTEEVKLETELTNIKGVGPKTAEKLIEKNITTIVQVAVMRSEELAEILNISNKIAKDIVNDAKDQALDKAIGVSSLSDVIRWRKEVMKRIPTGASALDMLLNGGVPTTAITYFKGEYASGKTQLELQLAVNMIKYHKRKIVWIETENGTFIPDRLIEMATAQGIIIDIDNDIIVVPAIFITTPHALFLAYQRIEQEIIKKNLDIGMIVVDSFSAPFRGYFSGREMLPDRSKEEARHLMYLNYLAGKYNLAVVMSIQVMDIPDPGQQLGERVKSGSVKRAFGGNVLTHAGTYMISLEKKSMLEWEAVVFDAPDLPMKSARFMITSAGIRDTTTHK